MPAHDGRAPRHARSSAPRQLEAREAALAVVVAVLERGRPLDETLAETLPRVPERDRGLTRLIATVTLRRLGQIDALLAGRLRKPLGPKLMPVVQVLRLGAAQLLFAGIAPHAAVDSSVRLVEMLGFEPMKGLVNGVLRGLSRDGAEAIAGQDAAILATPDWLLESWIAAYGEATARAIATAHLGEPPLDLTLAPDLDPADWAARLGAAILPTGSLRRAAATRVDSLPGYAEGAFWIQDAAAALPARLLGEVRGLKVLDLCAAPGGKTLQLAAAGGRVTAVEQNPGRIGRLRENLDRMELVAEIVQADAATWRPPEPADIVLLDAPCSATGTIRRHPDIPWLKRPEDLKSLAPLQDRLLDAACAMLRPGGRLLYCVCSLQKEEGEDRVDAALARLPLRLDPILPGEAGTESGWLSEAGTLRTLPCHWPEQSGLDGFFIARMIKM